MALDGFKRRWKALFTRTLREIVVFALNDASKDSSGQVLDRIARDEPRMKVIRATK